VEAESCISTKYIYLSRASTDSHFIMSFTFVYYRHNQFVSFIVCTLYTGQKRVSIHIATYKSTADKEYIYLITLPCFQRR